MHPFYFYTLIIFSNVESSEGWHSVRLILKWPFRMWATRSPNWICGALRMVSSNRTLATSTSKMDSVYMVQKNWAPSWTCKLLASNHLPQPNIRAFVHVTLTQGPRRARESLPRRQIAVPCHGYIVCVCAGKPENGFQVSSILVVWLFVLKKLRG